MNLENLKGILIASLGIIVTIVVAYIILTQQKSIFELCYNNTSEIINISNKIINCTEVRSIEHAI